MLRRSLLALAAVLALTACDGGEKEPEAPPASSSASSTEATEAPSPDATSEAPAAAAASHDTPEGAMTGLLEAMRAGDTEAVKTWISPAPESDRASVTQVERLQAMLGGEGRLFWLVDAREIVSATTDGEEAVVELDGYLVWCTGAGPDDEKASCAQPNGSGDEQTPKYDAVRVEGQWYVRLDLNRGRLIEGNPGAEGVAA